MRRRDFLRNSSAAALAVGASTPFVHASNKSGSAPVIIGSGEHRYECHHGWGEVPAHIKWYETHGIAVDSEGLVYVTHRAGADKPKNPEDAQDTVVVFDASGKFVHSFGKEYHGGGHGIDVRVDDGQEYLYLCQMFPVNLVVKTDLKGNVIWIKDRTSLAGSHVYDAPDAKFSPTNVAFAPDGGLYLGDGYGSNYVHQYNANGDWVRTWGGTGTEPGKMRTPHGLWWDNRPGREASLVVADRANNRLQYFSATASSKPSSPTASASPPTSTPEATSSWSPTCTPSSPCSTRTTSSSSASAATTWPGSRKSRSSRSARTPPAGSTAASSTPTTPASTTTATSSSPNGWRRGGFPSCGRWAESDSDGIAPPPGYAAAAFQPLRICSGKFEIIAF